MFSLIMGRALMATVRAVEHPLQRLEAALALAAGEKRGVQRQVVHVDVAVSSDEWKTLAKNKDLLAAMARAEVAKDMGEVPTCGACGAAT
jgi:hypothetical protein